MKKFFVIGFLWLVLATKADAQCQQQVVLTSYSTQQLSMLKPGQQPGMRVTVYMDAPPASVGQFIPAYLLVTDQQGAVSKLSLMGQIVKPPAQWDAEFLNNLLPNMAGSQSTRPGDYHYAFPKPVRGVLEKDIYGSYFLLLMF